jgi:hypothetical protein
MITRRRVLAAFVAPGATLLLVVLGWNAWDRRDGLLRRGRGLAHF